MRSLLIYILTFVGRCLRTKTKNNIEIHEEAERKQFALFFRQLLILFVRFALFTPSTCIRIITSELIVFQCYLTGF